MKTTRIGALLVVLSAFLLGSWPALAAPPQFIKGHGKPPATSNAPGIQTQATAVDFNVVELGSARYQDEVELTLPNAKKHSYILELSESHGSGITSWVAKHKSKGNQYRAIVTTGPGGSYGVFDTPDGEYRLIPGDGNDWLIDMTAERPYLPTINLGDDGLVPPAPTAKRAADAWYEPAIMTRIPGVNSVAVTEATPVPQNIVDIMFVYTKGLADNLGANLMTRLYFLVTRANTTYADSEVALTMRLVNATMVNYSDAVSDSVALNAISPPAVSGGAHDAATFGNIETIRASVGADAVAFMRNGSSFGGSGLAWVSIPTSTNYMYSLTTGCVSGCESVFIHEVGHNMGNKHDRATSAYQAGGTSAYSAGIYPYSFGHYYCASGTLTCDPTLPNNSGGSSCTSQPECSTSDAANFSTIMTYFQGTAAKVYKFSNPNLTCGTTSQPCGVSEVAPNSAYDALSMNNNRAIIAGMKPTVVGGTTLTPGSLQFTATGFSALESAGTVAITVSRIGGSDGAVSVSYATSDGTALAGLDYTATSGNLNWANLDTANKTINVTIANDGVNENGEAFTVTLSNATGTTGVFLGHPSSASVSILAAFPAGGTMPAGWTSAATPAAPWTTAADQVYEGTTSLRSHNVLAAVQGTYVNSDLTTPSMTFVAGNVGFAYKVLAYPSYGYIELLIDGVSAFQDTDTFSVGWKFASVPITAGAHTLTFRFKNRLNFACASAIPAPPSGGACADRAWIDSVSLPLSLATANNVLASSLNPSTSGQSVTFTSTSTGGSGTPTGIVNFKDGGSSIAGCNAAPMTGGIATCVTSALSTGGHSITAQYSGDVTYNPITSNTVSQNVNPVGGAAKHSEFNGDTRSDVLWRDATGGLVYEWQMNGLTISSQNYLPSVPSAWSPVGIGDASGDGKADVLWRDNTGLNYLWIVNGFSITSQGYLPSVPAPWVVVGMGDMSGDGKADVLWRNPTTGQNYIWILDGLTITSQGFLPTVSGTDWEVVGVADYSGDGKHDVLWRNKTTGQVYLWVMNGLAVASQGFLPSVTPVDWEIVASPDSNADGKADVLWRNKVNGQMYLWQMNGLTVSSQGFLLTVADVNWKVVGYGDYDGDGRGDVLWRNAGSALNYVWTLNGLTVAIQGFLPNVSGANWNPVAR